MIFDVIGFGALNLDRLYMVDKIAKRGEERFVTGCVETPGGSAANTIVGLARLGQTVGYVGKVGNDPEGDKLVKSLRDERVDTEGIVISKEDHSGIVTGFVDEKGERTLYVSPGVNDTLDLGEVNRKYITNTKFIHITSFVGEKPFTVQKKLLGCLQDVKVSFDPGALYARKGLVALKPILRQSYIVFPNETEIRLITGLNYEDGAKVLLNEGATIVAVKLGARGCYITDGKQNCLIDAFKVRIVDTTGAGDAFCAGFLYGLIHERDLHTCGRIANFCAGHKIEKVGAREGLVKILDLPEI